MLRRAKPALEQIMAALVEGAGLAAIAVLGAQLLYGPVVAALPASATLAPAVLLGAAVALYRIGSYARSEWDARHHERREPAIVTLPPSPDHAPVVADAEHRRAA